MINIIKISEICCCLFEVMRQWRWLGLVFYCEYRKPFSFSKNYEEESKVFLSIPKSTAYKPK